MRKEDILPTAVEALASTDTNYYVLVHDPATGKTKRIGLAGTTDPSVKGAVYFNGTRLALSTNGF